MGEQGSVNNHDIVGLYNRLNRFIVELHKSVSSQTSQVNEFDQERLASYLDAVDTFHKWVISQPHLDLPETAPRTYTLEASPEVTETENENVNDLIRLLTLARDELTNSQSARDPANLNRFDSNRLTAMISKSRAFLTDYIVPVTPLDLPESSPQEASTGSGLTGI